MMDGYIYIFRTYDEPYVITSYKTPDMLIKTHGVEYAAIIHTANMNDLEDHLRQRFADKCTGVGDCFNLSEEDIDYIKGLQS